MRIATGILACASFVLCHRLQFLAGGDKRHKHKKLGGICEGCGPALNDPFSKQYCGDLYSECTCCRDRIAARQSEICSQFMGYGGCHEGIQSKIAEIDGCVKNAQIHQKATMEAKKDEISDVLGKDIFSLVESNGDAKQENKLTSVPSGEYSMECLQDCDAHKALCAFDYGCSRALEKKKKELSLIESRYELYHLKNEEWHTLYNGLCPQY